MMRRNDYTMHKKRQNNNGDDISLSYTANSSDLPLETPAYRRML